MITKKTLPPLTPDGYRLKALNIALPVVVQHLLVIGLNMIDTLMLGHLGVLELSGVGAANRIYIIFVLCSFGFLSGASILLSQYWGVRDVYNIRRIVWIDYAFSIAFSLFLIVITGMAARSLIGFFADDAAVIGYGAEYLRTVRFSYLLNACSNVIIYNSRSVHRVRVVTAINVLALACNTLLNYGLIYGNLGLPALGVRGAALATVIARLIELVALLLYVYHDRRHPLAVRLAELHAVDSNLVRRVLRKALPTTASQLVLSAGTAMYYAAYGKTSDAALAVVQVCAIVNDFFHAFYTGLCAAAAVMIGNELGRRQLRLAREYARRFLTLGAWLAVLFFICFVLLRAPVIAAYDFDTFSSALLWQVLLIFGLFVLPRMLNYLLGAGILRAGGDTRFTLATDICTVWLLGVPLVWLGAVVWQLQLSTVVALSFSGDLIKLIIYLLRLRSDKWMNVLI